MKIEIPADIDAMKGIARARTWEKAAWVHAYCKPQQGKRTSTKTSGSYTIEKFAELGIVGLRSIDTVRLYWHAWQDAIDAGKAKPVRPGEVFILPDLPWPLGPVGDSNYTKASDEQRAAWAAVAEETGVSALQIARTAASAPAIKAAIKADPRIAEAAEQALAETREERLKEAHLRAIASGGRVRSPEEINATRSTALDAAADAAIEEADRHEAIAELKKAASAVAAFGFFGVPEEIADIRSVIELLDGIIVKDAR